MHPKHVLIPLYPLGGTSVGRCDSELGLQIYLLDEEVLEAAVTVQRLQQRRANLKSLHHTLQVGLVLCSFATGHSRLCTLSSVTHRAMLPDALNVTFVGTTLCLCSFHHSTFRSADTVPAFALSRTM